MKKLPHRLLCFILLLMTLAPKVLAARLLIPGGQVIGIRLENDTVTIASMDETLGENAKNAGLRPGDRLLQIGDTKISPALWSAPTVRWSCEFCAAAKKNA